MKYLYLFLVLFSATLFAQDNPSIPSTSIPRADANSPKPSEGTPQYSISKPFNPERFKTPKKFEPISMDKPMQVQPQISDLKPGLAYEKKLNKRQGEGSSDSKLFRRNQFMGEFKTKSATIGLNYRDFGEIDGDNIRIWIDGKIVLDFATMYGNFEKVFLGLVPGINKIEIEALNEGVYSPNTGEFRFVDENGALITSDLWNISTGFRAVFIIVRE